MEIEKSLVAICGGGQPHGGFVATWGVPFSKLSKLVETPLHLVSPGCSYEVRLVNIDSDISFRNPIAFGLDSVPQLR